ncbi:hypothetical protein [Persicobacter psychrovividus]|uniref:Uncharacterized protein n=1 Tax=Persicobacter psychrovividus TaxID=387638 RepID=A0ABM7VM45_9BACT|nr:hypothetical protein PEPS_43680 [Persicobacter psychrovividus]
MQELEKQLSGVSLLTATDKDELMRNLVTFLNKSTFIAFDKTDLSSHPEFMSSLIGQSLLNNAITGRGGLFDGNSYQVGDGFTTHFSFGETGGLKKMIASPQDWQPYSGQKEYRISKDSVGQHTLNSWGALDALKHYTESFIIVDNYLLQRRDKNGISDFQINRCWYNLKTIVEQVCAGNMDEPLDLLVCANFGSNDELALEDLEFWYDKLNWFLEFDLGQTQVNLTFVHDADKSLHDRWMFSHYFAFKSGNSFSNYFSERAGQNCVQMKGGTDLSVIPMNGMEGEVTKAKFFIDNHLLAIGKVVQSTTLFKGNKECRLLEVASNA